MTWEFYDVDGQLIDSITMDLDHPYCDIAWQGFESEGDPIRTVRIHYPTVSPFGTVFDLLQSSSDPTFLGTNYCLLTVNSTGAPARITATGLTSVSANHLELQAGPLPAIATGIFFYGTGQTQLPFGFGTLCVAAGSGLFRLPVVHAEPTGVLCATVDLDDPPSAAGRITAGSTWNFQAWFRDPAAGPPAFNTSDGLEITFRP